VAMAQLDETIEGFSVLPPIALRRTMWYNRCADNSQVVRERKL
jgi:hypothetical protein